MQSNFLNSRISPAYWFLQNWGLLIPIWIVVGTVSLAQEVPNHVVISEVYISGTDDWIELYNPTNGDIDLAGGYRIERATASGGDPTYYMSIGNASHGAYPGGTVIPAHGFYLIVDADASDELRNNADAIIAESRGFALTDNNVIYLATGTVGAPTNSHNDDPDIVDYVGYGAALQYEGSGQAPAPPDGKSIERKSLRSDCAPCQDTDTNSVDFEIRDTPTPMNSSSPPMNPAPVELFKNGFKAGFTNIQDAVNNASAGDTILVHNGIYTENIDVNKSLTIRSENGPDSTIVQAADPTDHVFEVTVDSVNISGFTVKNAISGSKAGICLNSVAYCNISNNTVSNNAIGIPLLSYSVNNTLAHNTIKSNTYYGIYLIGSVKNHLNNNTVSNNHTGIHLTSTLAPIIESSGNILASNTVNSNVSFGIELYRASNNTLTNNTVSYNYHGIVLISAGLGIGLSVFGNTLTNNTVSYNNHDGIYCYRSRNTLINKNNIYGNIDFGVYNADTVEGRVNAILNWWDHVSGPAGVGPGTGDAVSNYVDFDPWLHGWTSNGLGLKYITQAQGQWFNSAPTLDLTFYDDDSLTAAYYQYDSYSGSWVTLSPAPHGTAYTYTSWTLLDFNSLNDGSHTIYFKASDDSGNVEGESGEWSWQFYKDVMSPSIPILVSPDSDLVISDTTPTFIWHHSTDTLSGVDHYILQGAYNFDFSDSAFVYNTTDTAFTIPDSFALSDTSYYWHVRAVDAATNQSSWSNTWNFRITFDNTPPTMEPIVEPEGQYYRSTPSFSNFGFDDDCGLDSIWYKIDSAAWDSLFFDVPGTSWDSDGWTIPGFDTLSEGSHTIYFKVRDDAGYVSVWSWQFYKDTEPPTIPVLIYPSDGLVLIDRTPTFIWHKSTDDLSGVKWYEIMYANNPEFSGPSKFVKYLTDTTYTPSSDITEDIIYWVVKAIDHAGNSSFWSTKWYFTYDSEAPLPPTLVSPIGGTWLNDTLVVFEWTQVARTKGPGTNVHYIIQVDGNNLFASPYIDTTDTTPYTLVLTEGFYYWRVRAYDDAGNQGSFSSTESFGVDITRPGSPTLVAPPDSALQNTPAFVFIWNAVTDNPSGVDHYVLEYASNRVFWNATSVNVTDTVYVTDTLADSTYWWHVRAVDRAGNESPWSNRRCATIDTEAPAVPVLISPLDSSYINTITPTFVWGAATSTYCLQVGLDATFDTLLVVDTCGLTDTFYTVTDSSLFDTLTYHWRVEAIDDANNHSGYQVHPFMFTIDTIPPPIPTLLSPEDSSFTNDNTPTFVWSLVDLDTLITYCLQVATDTLFDSASIVIDACNLTDTSYTVSDTLALADSIYYWRAEAVDRAGNHSGYQTPFMFTVDTQAPIFTLTTVWDDTSFTGPYPISSVITDALSGVDSAFLYYSFDAGTTWSNIGMQLTPPDTYQADIPQVPDSNTTVQYYLEANDPADNIGYDPANAPDSFYSFVGGTTTDEKLGITEQTELPTVFALLQNHPNPFIQSTVISYSIGSCHTACRGGQIPDIREETKDQRPENQKSHVHGLMSEVSLRIYNLSGRLVRTLVNELQKPGYYTVVWDGNDSAGKEVTTGIYFCKIQVDDFTQTKKMIMMR